MRFRTDERLIKRHLLIDFNNVFYKAIHVAKHIDKVPSADRVIFHFFRMLSSWIREMPPDQMRVSFFYDGRPVRRIAMDSTYKATRVQTDETKALIELTRPTITRLIESCDVDVYGLPDAEADDLIATFAKENEGDLVIVLSDDKDFFQLLTVPGVVIFRPCEGVGSRFVDAERSAEIMGSKSGQDKHLVYPSQIRLFKALCGDPSDNIKGVFRLQRKFAAHMSQAKDVDEMIEKYLPDIPETTRVKVMDYMESIRKNYEIVGFQFDCDLAKALKSKRPAEDREALLSQHTKLRFMDLRCFGVHTKAPSYTPDFLSDL